jgi:hypothetical protein
VAGLFAGRFEEAAAYARLTIQANPAFSVPYAYLAAAYVNLGEPEAAAAMRRLLDVEPAFTVEGFARRSATRRRCWIGWWRRWRGWRGRGEILAARQGLTAEL